MNCCAPKREKSYSIIRLIICFIIFSLATSLFGGFVLQKLSNSILGVELTFHESFWIISFVMFLILLFKSFLYAVSYSIGYAENCNDVCCNESGTCQHSGDEHAPPAHESEAPDEVIIHLSPEMKARLDKMWQMTDSDNVNHFMYRALNLYEYLLKNSEENDGGQVEVILKTPDGEQKIIIG